MQVRSLPALACLTLLLLVDSQHATAKTWLVPGHAGTIREGLDLAAEGDTVRVACGTYYEHSIVLKSGVTLRSATGQPGCVTIDAQALGRHLYGEGLAPTTRVEGLTLTGGWVTGSTTSAGSGGSIYLSDASPQIRDCVFRTNRARYYGGALRCVGSSPTIVNCLFVDNAVPGGGGGAISTRYGSAPVTLDCRFLDNVAAWGGAFECRVESHPLIVSCLFQANRALPTRGFGGAVFCDYTSSPSLERCTLIFNEALSGGALALFSEARPSIERCTIAANVASESGGGLLCLQAAPEIRNSIIAFHHGEGVAAFGGILPSLFCSDIFGNSGGDWDGVLAAQLGQHGNLHADPLFYSTPFDGPEDFNLQIESPCSGSYSSCGMMGSRPIGPDSSTGNWPPHQFIASPGWVSIRWSLGAPNDDLSFRLLAQLDAQEWEVPFTSLGDGEFLAEDRAECLEGGGQVIYSLYYRDSYESWRLAWSVPVTLLDLPPRVQLSRVYPNPFNPRTSIQLEVQTCQHVRLLVHDLRGRELAVIHDGQLGPGTHEFSWDGTDSAGRALPAGTYLAIAHGAGMPEARKLTLVR